MATMSSKFIIDSMLPKYAASQFQPFFNSHLNNNQSTTNSTVSQTTPSNNSEGSPLTGSEEGSSPPTSNNKMYPFVSNHPSSHTTYPTMPGFTGLDDKSCG